jgi:transposase
MNTPNPEIQIPAPGRRHNRYSLEFKREVIAACLDPGVSKAAIALANGLNANMLRRWVVESTMVRTAQLATITKPALAAQARSDFIPVKFTPATPAQAADIRIELQHGTGTVQIHWPMAASNQCAQWLREVLA